MAVKILRALDKLKFNDGKDIFSDLQLKSVKIERNMSKNDICIDIYLTYYISELNKDEFISDEIPKKIDKLEMFYKGEDIPLFTFNSLIYKSTILYTSFENPLSNLVTYQYSLFNEKELNKNA